MARPPRHKLSTPFAVHPHRIPKHALWGAVAAIFLTTLVALPFSVLYRAAVSQALQDSWGWEYTRPSLSASEEDGAQGVDFSEEKRFLTSGYLEMMWKRLDFLRMVLQKGYSFIFSDADIMWFRNPFPHFYPDGDFQIACDHYVGNATDLRNIANGGFNYVKSNERSIEFYNF